MSEERKKSKPKKSKSGKSLRERLPHLALPRQMYQVLLILYGPVAVVLFGYLVVNGPLLLLHEAVRFHVWWPFVFLVQIGAVVALFARGTGREGNDPIRSVGPFVLVLVLLPFLALTAASCMFFARAWSYSATLVPFVGAGALLLTSASLASALGVGVMSTRAVRRATNRVVLAQMMPVITAKLEGAPSGEARGAGAKRKVSGRWDALFALLGPIRRRLEGKSLDAYVTRKRGALVFRQPSDHYLQTLQTLARNACTDAEIVWVDTKWTALSSKIRGTHAKQLGAAFVRLEKLQNQFIVYASLYQGFPLTTSHHLFALPWMSVAVRVRFVLERLQRWEQLYV